MRSVLAFCKTKQNPISLILLICQGRRNRKSNSQRTCSRLFHLRFHCSCSMVSSTAVLHSHPAGTLQGVSSCCTITLVPLCDKEKCGCTVLHVNEFNKSLFILHFPNRRHEKQLKGRIQLGLRIYQTH